MKNLFFSFLVLILSAGTVAFGQISNSEIHKIIMMSKEANVQNGIFDPNKIFPGQKLTFIFEDGHEQEIYVEPGDNQWSVVKNKLSWYESLHGEVVEPDLEPNQGILDQTEPKVQSEQENSNDVFWLNWKPGWLDLIIVILVVAGLYIIIKALTHDDFRQRLNQPLFPERKKVEPKFSSDPTKEGPRFIETGIHTEEQASRRFVDLARRDNPNINPSQIVITERKRVYVSTPDGEAANVEFADGTIQELAFRNTPGWQAMVSVDGGKSFQRELFFVDCGNPVYSRKSLTDAGLIITDEPINFGDEVVNNKTANAENSAEVLKESIINLEKEVDKFIDQEKPVVIDSEAFRIQNHQLSVIEELAGNQKIHKAVQKIIYNADGSWSSEVSIDTKNEPVSKEEVKKEN
jgi:hypothetical protein